MSQVLGLLGSPSKLSRSGSLLAQLEARLAVALDDDAVSHLALRELPPAALLAGNTQAPAIAAAIAAVREARVLLVATPIYKAAYSGLLKSFLDLLPPDALRGKTVVPLATGASVAHQLALDYALKPVLAALGARDIRDAVFAADAELPLEAGTHRPLPALQVRLDRLTADLLGPGPGAPLAAALWLRVVNPVRTAQDAARASNVLSAPFGEIVANSVVPPAARNAPHDPPLKQAAG